MCAFTQRIDVSVQPQASSSLSDASSFSAQQRTGVWQRRVVCTAFDLAISSAALCISLYLVAARCSSLQLVAARCSSLHGTASHLQNIESHCIAAHLICITHLHIDVLQRLPSIIVDFAIVKKVVWILQTSLAADCLDVLCFEV